METKRKSRVLEPIDYVKMLRRMIRSAGVRVGDGDPEDLAELLALRADIDQAVSAAIERQRSTGITWQSIGEALGTTRQAALMRWGKSSD